MPSGRKSRQQRKAGVPKPPPVRSGGARQRQASPKVLIAIAVALVVIGAGVAAALVFTGGSSSSTSGDFPTRGTLENALPGADEVQSLFKGIPQQGNILGKASAPVTMVEYVDLQCPYCRDFETEAMPTLLDKYIRSGKVKVEARVLAFIGGDSERGRKAAIAAAQQNHMFDYMELLYFNQASENTGWLDERMVEAAAASIPGMDVPALMDARDASAIKQREQKFEAQATADRVNSTPTILVGKTGKALKPVQLQSPTDVDSVSAAIDDALGT